MSLIKERYLNFSWTYSSATFRTTLVSSDDSTELFRTPATTSRFVGNILNMKCDKSYKYVYISSSKFTNDIKYYYYIFYRKTILAAVLEWLQQWLGNGLENSDLESRRGHENFLSWKTPRRSLLLNERIFKWLSAFYCRVKRPDHEVDHSHSYSVNVKSECVYVEI